MTSIGFRKYHDWSSWDGHGLADEHLHSSITVAKIVLFPVYDISIEAGKVLDTDIVGNAGIVAKSDISTLQYDIHTGKRGFHELTSNDRSREVEVTIMTGGDRAIYDNKLSECPQVKKQNLF